MALFACNTLEVEITSSGVAEITLQRPHVLNAMNSEMIAELTAVLDELSENDKVRVLCLQGAGNHFCAGADLKWMQKSIEYDAKENFNDAAKFSLLLHALDNFPKPTLAVVEGAAYGGGIGLVACCDMAIGTTDTEFCLAEAKLGLVPAIISPYIVSAIGARAFRYWALLATPFSATHAHNMGLLHEVAGNPVQLAVVKKQIVQHLLNNGPNALGVIKRLSKRLSISMADTELHQELAELIASVRVGEEAQERMTQFLEKSLK
jgi:methylglutaconyl-CoA hydratase